ncbi:MAG: hypothetical protein D4R67_11045 [Bacteroidetes bacterium]|nr:MAG: hypothetical protein D4R67_11045 [Bacteroidota bacterium]
MNRCLRLRSRSLIVLLLFVASLAFACPLFLPLLGNSSRDQQVPDTTYTSHSSSSDSLYLQLIILADDYFGKKDYLNAKSSYQLALNRAPNDPYAREQLNRTMELLRSQKAQNILYDVTLASADKLFNAGDYEKAKAEYENAGRILPGEAYPKEKINAIIKIMVDQQVREELYKEAITAGDRYYNSAGYQRALPEYQKALKQKPEEPYPRERIAELQQILAQLAALQEAYTEAIALADKLFTETRYPDARSAYEEAQGIKPQEQYPADRIREIDAILAGIAKSNAAFEQYVNLADSFYIAKNFIRARQNYQLALQVKPNESYPRAMIAKTEAGVGDQQANELAMEDAYRSAVANADKLFAEQALAQAKAEYENALAIKPADLYPQQKIKEIDAILEGIARSEKLESDYAAAIAAGDSLLVSQAYRPAKSAYQNALALKPGGEYPAGKISEIDVILSEQARLQSLNEQYEQAIASGDQFFKDSSWEQARELYQQARSVKPDESYPAQQLAIIDQKLAEITRLQRALDEQYAHLIQSGDQLFGEKDYPSAQTTFRQALELKPGERYPSGKVSEIDNILQEMAQKDALEAQYAQTIGRGDSLLAGGFLTPAKNAFEEAMRLKPEEAYPKSRVSEINAAIEELNRQQVLDNRYREEVATGDRLFSGRSWDPAIAAYQRAMEMKPAETYPGQKIREADSIKQEIARQLRIDQEYREIIARADRLLGVKSYDSARVDYSRAGELRPEKSYWKEQIEEIDHIQAEIRRRNEEYQAAIALADGLLTGQQYESAREAYQNASLIKPTETYPKEKIKEVNQLLAEIQGRRQTFDKLVSNGDQFLAFREYIKARENYQQALDLFPDETYPKARLRVTNARIDSIYRANKADYDKAVGEGDGFFNTFEYDRAIDAYTRAVGFLPMEEYPREMIAKIRKTISENAIADVLNSPVVIKAGEEQKFPFDPVNIASRRNNFIYLKVRNLTANNFSVLLRYGRDDHANGGLAIRNITSNREVNERLISVKDQDPWYREDNNWISLYPQGGDIEVSFIQVSRAIK